MSLFTKLFQRDPLLRQHLTYVYECVICSLVFACLGSAFGMALPEFHGFMMFATGTVGATLILGVLHIIPCTMQTIRVRLAYMCTFAFFTGLTMAPAMAATWSVEPTLIATALVGAAVVFGCMTTIVLLADNTTWWIWIGSYLTTALTLMFGFTIVDIFVSSSLLLKVSLFAGMSLFSGFVLFDTSLIIDKFENGETDFVMHSIYLYLDFINIVQRLVMLLLLGKNLGEAACKSVSQPLGYRGWVEKFPFLSHFQHFHRAS